jgi:hypothetical protein
LMGLNSLRVAETLGFRLSDRQTHFCAVGV